MTDRPIIFNGAMVRALLTGTKTQTRRIAKITAVMGNKVAIESPDEKLIELEDGEFRRGIFHYESTSALSGPYRLPYAVGDRLWVREAFAVLADKPRGSWIYRADSEEARSAGPRVDVRWKPSIHMPRWASRLTLPVTDVRVQRLQQISEEDAIAEGAPCCTMDDDGRFYEDADRGNRRLGFAGLWDSLHGSGAWDANPWIVALTFEVERSNIDEVKR